jgi:hypothetical protein
MNRYAWPTYQKPHIVYPAIRPGDMWKSKDNSPYSRDMRYITVREDDIGWLVRRTNGIEVYRSEKFILDNYERVNE